MTSNRRGIRARRRAFLACAAASASAAWLRWPADAAEFEYKVGDNSPLDHPFSVHLSEAVAKIRQESNGRLDIKLFANNVLGDDAAMLSQVRLGALEFVLSPDVVIANVVPLAALDDVGFAFSTHKALWAAQDGALGAYIRAGIAKLGVFPFERIWDGGFKQITNSQHPIVTPDDLRGLRIRVPPSPGNLALYKTLGAAPTGVSLSQMYTSLQTHLLDGADIALSSIEAQKLYEVQKYLSITNHNAVGVILLANAAVWQSLPKQLRDIADRQFNEAGQRERLETVKQEETLQATLAARGMAINQTDPAIFQAALQKGGYYGTMRQMFGDQAWAVLEKAVGKLP